MSAEVEFNRMPPDPDFQEFLQHLEKIVFADIGLPADFFDPPDEQAFAA